MDMMRNIAIGDAYGAGFEFATDEFILENNKLSHYIGHPSGGLRAGQYTDDTQRSLAIAELMLTDLEWTPLNIANKMVEVFKRDPRDGYARGYQKFLQEVSNGEEFLAKIKPHSKRNGAAMSSVPLGLYEDIDILMKHAEAQAKITHDTPVGIVSSQAIALLAHMYIYDLFEEDGTDIIPQAVKFIKKHTGFEFQYNWKRRVGCDAYETVCGVLTALHKFDHSRETLLVGCVRMGGDTDSVASIANGIYIGDDPPAFAYHTLEDGRYGLHYLDALDEELYDKFLKDE